MSTTARAAPNGKRSSRRPPRPSSPGKRRPKPTGKPAAPTGASRMRISKRRTRGRGTGRLRRVRRGRAEPASSKEASAQAIATCERTRRRPAGEARRPERRELVRRHGIQFRDALSPPLSLSRCLEGSNSRSQKRDRGRPGTGVGRNIDLRRYPELEAALDAWIAEQPEPRPARPEAIRNILRKSLSVSN